VGALMNKCTDYVGIVKTKVFGRQICLKSVKSMTVIYVEERKNECQESMFCYRSVYIDNTLLIDNGYLN
jgi:hypothetical protein